MIDVALAGHTSITDLMDLTLLRLRDVRMALKSVIESRKQ